VVGTAYIDGKANKEKNHAMDFGEEFQEQL